VDARAIDLEDFIDTLNITTDEWEIGVRPNCVSFQGLAIVIYNLLVLLVQLS